MILKLIDETSAQHGQDATCPSEGYRLVNDVASLRSCPAEKACLGVVNKVLGHLFHRVK